MPSDRAEIGRHGSESRRVKRSTSEWIVRGVLTLGVASIAYVSVAGTLANVIVEVDANAADALAIVDGRIMAASAAQKFAASPNSSSTSAQAKLARKALLRDPTAVDALSVLAFQAQMRSDEKLTDRLFSYSVALSRREFGPQMWRIEKDVSLGDVDGALRNYDLALRTSDKARQMLFPVLASSTVEPEIRERLIRMLERKPAWDQAFIHFSANSGSDPTAVAQLFRESEGKGLPVEMADQARLVTRLVTRGLMDEAWDYYQTFRSAVARNHSRDPEFNSGVENPTPFDWNIGTMPGLSAAILRQGSDGFLDFALPPSTRATVVKQTQLLPPGDYRLEGRIEGVDQPERSRPYWVLSCLDGTELVRVDLPGSSQVGATFSGRFSVPADCAVQSLSLVARASDEIEGVTGRVENVQIVPVGG
ncbi:hypothetical protein KK137_04365 [Croceibacterium sp. LX-88]|uniref:Uncharacterized protein n=1 Tax=Croceibacterium selenioxidans TaxID=2838833 RepID=A0ABS5W1C2_9SPHN|nr:hypothetical protein [Croceibacterium selenioxidans]MBT2133563.1 hypothetical protein [Croceibacterium selenioxidans]